MKPGRLVLSAALLLGAFLVLQLRGTGEAVPVRQPLSEFPSSLGGWEGRPATTLDVEVLNILKVKDYLMRRYTDQSGKSLWLYVGYWDSQRKGAQPHSPRNCLPGGGWEPLEATRLPIPLPDGQAPITVNRYRHPEGPAPAGGPLLVPVPGPGSGRGRWRPASTWSGTPSPGTERTGRSSECRCPCTGRASPTPRTRWSATSRRCTRSSGATCRTDGRGVAMVAFARRWPVLVLSVLVLGGALAGGCARSPEAKKARHLERGDKYFQKAQYKEALIEYANALRIEPSNARAIQQIGLSHYELGEWLQAFPFLMKTQQLAPDNQDVRIKVGSIYLRGRHLEEAEDAARTVLEKEPRNLEALGLLAGAADAPEEIDAAIQQLEAARGEHRQDVAVSRPAGEPLRPEARRGRRRARAEGSRRARAEVA